MAGADAAAAAASANATTRELDVRRRARRERGERACEAARNGDADALKAILDESPEAARYECGSRPTADGYIVYRSPLTPLHFAVGSGCCDAVRLLLDVCPELARKESSWDQSFLLHDAAKRGRADIVKLIFDAYPEAAIQSDDNGHPPLSYAAGTGDADTVKFLVDAYPQAARGLRGCQQHVNDEVDDDWVPVNDWMPLHDAAESGCADVVRLVLKAYPEAARHACRDDGKMPLHSAALFGDAETVKLLVEEYPEAARHADNTGAIPLYLAVCNGFHPDTPRMTDDNDDDDSEDAHHDGPKRRLRDYVTTAKVLLDAYFPEEEGARHRVLGRILPRREYAVAEPRLRLMLALAWAGIRPSQAWSTDMAYTMHGLTRGPWAQWEFVPLLRAHLSRIRAAMLVLYRRNVPLEVAQTVAGKLFALEMW